MKRTKARVLIAALIAALLLPGCSLFIPTPVSLVNAALTNIKKSKSAAVHADIDADAALTYEALNLSLDLTIGTGIDMEMTRAPQRSKGSADLNIGLMGQEQTIKGTFFTDKNEDNSRTTYIKWGDGNWKQKTEKSDESEESLENSTGLKGLPNSIAQGIAVMTAISDKSVQAELKKELVPINGRDAYQITCTIPGPLLKKLMESRGMLDKKGNIDLSKIDWDNTAVPSEIYIYKDKKLPARIRLDCKDAGAQMLGAALEDSLKDMPVEGLGVELRSCVVDLTFDRYNEIEPIEIPQEAMGAEEAEDLMPGLDDILSGL
mgnify:CR=1 FL=1